MRAFWVNASGTFISALATGIIATVKSKSHLYGATWQLWVHSRLVETGSSGTIRGAKTQATCAAREWQFHRDST